MFRSLLYRTEKSTGLFPRVEWSTWDSMWGEFDKMFSGTLMSGSDDLNVEIHIVDGQAVIEMELAGYAKKNITATVKDRLITISGKRKETNFVKTFRVQESFDMDSMAATYKNGLLVVTLNKLEKAKPDTKERTVPIQ